jgi:hypothetical protein
MSNYSVCEWGSHPDEGNDDCWTGADFDTLEEAEAMFAAEPHDASTAFVELNGPDVYRIREIPGVAARNRREAEADRRAWQHEMAVEAGMLHGIDAYNDEMGY